MNELTATVHRHKLLVLLVAGTVLAATIYFLSKQEPVYRSTTTIVFLPDSDDPVTVSFYGPLVEHLVPTYAELARSETFLEEAVGGLPTSGNVGKRLRNQVHTEHVPDSGVLRIVARSANPEYAAALAGAVGDAFVERLRHDQVVTVRIIDRARVPDTPVAPRPKYALAAALAVSFSLSVAAAAAWDRLFERIHDPAQLGQASGTSVLGVLLGHRQLPRRRGLSIGDDKGRRVPMERELRLLRTNLLVALRDAGVNTAAVTSVDGRAGCSTLVASLAVVLSEYGFSVLVVDAQLRRPRQHELFGTSSDRGLTSLVTDAADLSSLLQPTSYDGLTLLSAGPAVADSGELEKMWVTHLPQISRLADVVLIDAPPIEGEVDLRVMPGVGVVLAVPAGSVKPSDLRAAVDRLGVTQTPILGSVLVRAREKGLARPRRRWAESRKGSDVHPGSGDESPAVGVAILRQHARRGPRLTDLASNGRHPVR